MDSASKFENCIEIYLRLGPVIEGAVAEYSLNHEAKTVEWLVPRQVALGMTNHQREKYNFSFSGILGTDATQDRVFDTVARKVLVHKHRVFLDTGYHVRVLCMIRLSYCFGISHRS